MLKLIADEGANEFVLCPLSAQFVQDLERHGDCIRNIIDTLLRIKGDDDDDDADDDAIADKKWTTIVYIGDRRPSAAAASDRKRPIGAAFGRPSWSEERSCATRILSQHISQRRDHISLVGQH